MNPSELPTSGDAGSPSSARPFSRHFAQAADLPRSVETEFERPRDLIETEIRRGFTLFSVTGVSDPVAFNLIPVLDQLASSRISIDFLKLGAEGMSFVVPDESAVPSAAAMTVAGAVFTQTHGRCVLSVSSANLRDEEGLAASFMSAVIAGGTRLDHVSDMHDRVLFLIAAEDADRAVQALQSVRLGGVA